MYNLVLASVISFFVFTVLVAYVDKLPFARKWSLDKLTKLQVRLFTGSVASILAFIGLLVAKFFFGVDV